tara:strand:+ start:1302 stop:1436 length:135 start_codon:yes stop_codon:yes gene_type:complete
MNFSNIAIITILITLSLYLMFLLLGVGGIAQNREAQGIDHKSKK